MNPIRRILAKLRRRKAKPSLGRYFHVSLAAFNNGTKQYFNDSAGHFARPDTRGAGGTGNGPRSGAVT